MKTLILLLSLSLFVSCNGVHSDYVPHEHSRKFLKYEGWIIKARELPIVYKIHKDNPEKNRRAFYTAVNIWNEAWRKATGEANLFIIEGESDAEPTLYYKNIGISDKEFADIQLEKGQDYQNVIFASHNFPLKNTDKQATNHCFYDNYGVMYESDISVNMRDFSYFIFKKRKIRGYIDLVSLIVHELGHSLGLGHDNTELNIMNSYLDYGVIRRKIDKKTIEALKYVYLTPP